MNPLFVADSLAKSFGHTAVLKSATFTATPGEIRVLLGRNGCGKSTLLRAATGLVSADVGVVRFDGERIERPRLWSLASRGLFFLPQRGLLSKRLRLCDQIQLVRSRFGTRGQGLEALGLTEQARAFPDQLSGGERRRAELALAFERQPRCLLADEPLLDVDPKGRTQVLHALRELAERGTAVLITGHQADQLLESADQVTWMVGGVTHALGVPDEAIINPAFKADYLGAVDPLPSPSSDL